ncbi:uncharacterized protein LTR77_009263 [Saxophila tyrrhenica]|uniref:Uncharacterized protein n=1 Tax=Saxophila tyrrhenica TaxID=1690608 RepID=A0AAV9P2F4_9PEZI|nr:hypothetical protein LTR77_009263 [Saxophila tyrrhenica]
MAYNFWSQPSKNDGAQLQYQAIEGAGPEYPSPEGSRTIKPELPAHTTGERREKLCIDGQDDVGTVNTDASAVWVSAIVAAICTKTYAGPPGKKKSSSEEQLTDQETAWWERWQQKSQVDVKTHETSDDDFMNTVEFKAWEVFQSAVDTSHAGCLKGYVRNRPDLRLKCSERILGMIDGLEKYPIIRSSALKNLNYAKYAANPDAFANRKVVSCWNNWNKMSSDQQQTFFDKFRQDATPAVQSAMMAPSLIRDTAGGSGVKRVAVEGSEESSRKRRMLDMSEKRSLRLPQDSGVSRGGMESEFLKDSELAAAGIGKQDLTPAPTWDDLLFLAAVARSGKYESARRPNQAFSGAFGRSRAI